MAYIKKEEVKAIREELKRTFPKVKFSVTRENYSSVNVAVMKSDYDFSAVAPGRSIRPHFKLCFSERAKNFIAEIENIIKTAPAKAEGGSEWYDRSDAMTDYFDTAFYYNIEIGKWNKPHERI